MINWAQLSLLVCLLSIVSCGGNSSSGGDTDAFGNPVNNDTNVPENQDDGSAPTLEESYLDLSTSSNTLNGRWLQIGRFLKTGLDSSGNDISSSGSESTIVFSFDIEASGSQVTQVGCFTSNQHFSLINGDRNLEPLDSNTLPFFQATINDNRKVTYTYTEITSDQRTEANIAWYKVSDQADGEIGSVTINNISYPISCLNYTLADYFLDPVGNDRWIRLEGISGNSTHTLALETGDYESGSYKDISFTKLGSDEDIEYVFEQDAEGILRGLSGAYTLITTNDFLSYSGVLILNEGVSGDGEIEGLFDIDISL